MTIGTFSTVAERCTLCGVTVKWDNADLVDGLTRHWVSDHVEEYIELHPEEPNA